MYSIALNLHPSRKKKTGYGAGERIEGETRNMIVKTTMMVLSFNLICRHLRVSGDPGSHHNYWIPACAGMTIGVDSRLRGNDDEMQNTPLQAIRLPVDQVSRVPVSARWR